jgi:hypothetical protein
MTEQGWHTVITIVQETDTDIEQALAERLAAAVHVFDVPPSVLVRLHQATTAAVGRSFQHDDTRSISLTVSTRAMQPQAAQASASWGFFIVERPIGDGEHQHIEVFLYPDGG